MQPFEVVRTQGALQYGAIGKSSAVRPKHLQKLGGGEGGVDGNASTAAVDMSRTSGARSTSPTLQHGGGSRLGGGHAPSSTGGAASSPHLQATAASASAPFTNRSAFTSAKGTTVLGNVSPTRARASSPTRKLAPIPFCASPQFLQDYSSSGSSSNAAAARGPGGAEASRQLEGNGSRFHVVPINETFGPKFPATATAATSSQRTAAAAIGAKGSHPPAPPATSIASSSPSTAALTQVTLTPVGASAAPCPDAIAPGDGGCCVSDYFIPVTDFKLLVREQDEEYPVLRRTVTRVEIPARFLPASHPVPGCFAAKVADIGDSSFTPGALYGRITFVDESFFCPAFVSMDGSDGRLRFDLPQALTGKTGVTAIRFQVLDHASLRRIGPGPAGAEFDASDEASVDIVIGGPAPPPVPHHGHKQHTALTPAPTAAASAAVGSSSSLGVLGEVVLGRDPVFQAPAIPDAVPGACRTLSPMCVHAFRAAPDVAPPHGLAVQWVQHQPIFFTKCTSLAMERQLLQGRHAAAPACGVTIEGVDGAPVAPPVVAVQQADIEAALVEVHAAMASKQPVRDVVMPLLDRCVQLLLHVPSADNHATVLKLVGIRVDLAATLAGIGVEAMRLAGGAAAVRHAAATALPVHVALLVRVVVEAGHWMKVSGDYTQARHFYSVALAIAEGTAASTPGGGEAGRLVPFIRAVADAALLHGDLPAAAAAYERARALAEMADKAARMGNEQAPLGPTAVVLSCDADVAVCQALQHREDAAHRTITRVEHVAQQLLLSSERDDFLLLAVDCCVSGAVVALSRHSTQRALALLERAVGITAEYAALPHADDDVVSLMRANLETLFAVTRIAMALLAAERGSPEECTALLKQARDSSADEVFAVLPPAGGPTSSSAQKDVGLGHVLSSWVAAVADFPLTESPADTTEYDAVLVLAEGLVGRVSPLVTTMLLCRHLAVIDTAAEATATGDSRGALPGRDIVATHGLERLALIPEHPLLFVLNTSLVTICITKRAYATAVAALYRASHVWAACPMVRRDPLAARRLVAIGAYAVAYHTEGIARGAARPAAAAGKSVAATSRAVTTHNVSFAAAVDEVVQATLQDTHTISAERLLDAAEVRLCEAEYGSALELLGKALRIADSRNLMFLLDGLFVTQRSLSRVEIEDRNRLLQERRVSPKSLVAVGLVLLAIGIAHEQSRNYPKAMQAYEQAVAALEMMRTMHHPAAVEMLTGLARVSLLTGDIGDALSNIELARDTFLTHHFQCGAFRKDPALVALEENVTQTEQAAKTVMRSLNYVLLPHDAPFSGVTMHV